MGTSKYLLDVRPMLLAMHEAIYKPLSTLRKTCRLTEGQTEVFTDTLETWVRDFVALRCDPKDIREAIRSWAMQSPFFPTFSDVMQQAYGEGWANQRVTYRVPCVESGYVRDRDGKIREVYPLAVYRAETVRRIDVAKLQMIDERQALIGLVKRLQKLGTFTAEADRLSAELGHQVVVGTPSFEPKRGHAEIAPIRTDLATQLGRLQASAGA